MNVSSIIHSPKSPLSYACDGKTLHLRLKTAADDVECVTCFWVDPFNWAPRRDGGSGYEFDKESVSSIRMDKEQSTGIYDCWFAELPDIEWGRVKYCFLLTDAKDAKQYLFGCHDVLPDSGEAGNRYELENWFNFPYLNEADLYQAPDWVNRTVWYQIFPERFCNGSPEDGRSASPWGSAEDDCPKQKFGGNLLGIIQKLDYIKECGFNGIYLTPIFDSPSVHKYDTTDYFHIDPEFGNNEMLGKLVQEAHKRDIRIMLDAVFNHCGFLHPFWQDVLEHGSDSAYYDCFYIRDSEKPIVQSEIVDGMPGECGRDQLNYRTFAFTQKMPKWNTDHPLVRQHLIDAACYWIEQYHIDGWRLDVSNEVSHDFWREFRKKTKEKNPDIYLLGENWDNSWPWLQGDQFDSVMNYEFSTPVWKFFGKRDGVFAYRAEEFQNAVGKLLTDYPKTVTANLFNLLDSHDTGRILSIVGEDPALAKLAFVFLMTFPGCPCVYYGDEVGMSGHNGYSRRCMVWEEEHQDRDMWNFLSCLVQLRKNHESFRCESFRWLDLDAENTLLYCKETERETLYVMINRSAESTVLQLPDELAGRTFYDHMAGIERQLCSVYAAQPYEYLLLSLQGDAGQEPEAQQEANKTC